MIICTRRINCEVPHSIEGYFNGARDFSINLHAKPIEFAIRFMSPMYPPTASSARARTDAASIRPARASAAMSAWSCSAKREILDTARSTGASSLTSSTFALMPGSANGRESASASSCKSAKVSLYCRSKIQSQRFVVCCQKGKSLSAIHPASFLEQTFHELLYQKEKRRQLSFRIF